MEYANTFFKEISDMQARVIAAIEENLKRIGTSHLENDEEPLWFFSFKTTQDLSICGINADGSLMFTKSTNPKMEFTIRGYIENDRISLNDAVSLLQDLEQI